MTELPWFDQYAGQTTDELLALEGQYRTESLVIAVDDALQAKAARRGEAHLTDEERVVLAVEALEREVNNGGYDQFFINSSNAYAPIIVDALTQIGCTTAAAITAEAIAALGISGPVTVDAIDRVMDDDSEARSTTLNACDNRYYDEVGDLATPLWDYIRLNRSKITLPPGDTALDPQAPGAEKRWWEFWR